MTILSEIVRRKFEELACSKTLLSERELLARAQDVEPPRSLYSALSSAGGPLRVIAEVKRASPSAGVIAAELDAASQALKYAEAGAACISVLTDGPGFGGSAADLEAVRSAVNIPILRKDFTVDRYQLVEARSLGADAALLIVAALSDDVLKRLHDACGELGLAALVEVHNEHELERALALNPRIVGVNNRNLDTFEVDLAISEKLLPKLPANCRGVAESGVRTASDAKRLRRAGAANLLVGEALVRARNPGALLMEMSG